MNESTFNCDYVTQSSSLKPRHVHIINQLKVLHAATNEVSDSLLDIHGCGWFDGGCYTLAYAASQVIDEVEVYHASRSSDFRDHAVLKLKGVDLFFDADGLQTKEQLYNKMVNYEMARCDAIEPFSNFSCYVEDKVYLDIYNELLLVFNNAIRACNWERGVS